MRHPDTPTNEYERLAELRGLGVLDTEPEARFDRYTRLARQLLGVQTALVSLVDSDRQWFKSRQGLAVVQTGRDVSFCGHAILKDEVMEVQDALQDERFADNPLVTGAPFIRFYAGAPLHGPTGQRVGTLCVIDPQPRNLTPGERQSLNDLAQAVSDELNARNTRLLADRTQDAALRLAAVLDNMHDGVVTLDAQGDIRGMNRAAAQLFGHDLASLQGRHVSVLIPALDAARLADAPRHSEPMGRRSNGSDLKLALTIEPLYANGERGWTCLVRDTSAGQASYEMQARFAAIVESSDNAIMSLTPEGVITSWNAAAERVFGYNADEAVGQSMLMLVPPELTDETSALLERVAAGEPIAAFQTLRVSRSWQQLTVMTTLAPLRDASGAVIGASEITRDISQERKVGEQLRESEDRYQLAMRGSNAGLWDWDIANDEAYYSPRLCEMLGHTIDSLGTRFATLTSALHPEDDARFRAKLDEHLAGKRATFDVECRLQTQSGLYRWFAVRGEALRNELGLPHRMAGSLIDVHERREAQAALQSTSAMLQSVLDGATGVSIVATDERGFITVFNKGSENLLGYRAHEMVGQQTPLLYVDPAYIAETGATLSRLSGQSVEGLRVLSAPAMLGKPIETNFIRKDGSRVRVSAIVTLRHDSRGKRIGHVGIAIDITRQWEYEQSLREARVKAEQASVAKSQFLANVSHELRTPMNAILGMLQLMGNTALSARQLDYVKKTDGAARSLLHLLNDILDFSKVEAGKMALDPHPFRIDHLMRDLAVIAAANLGTKPVELIFDVDATVPLSLIGDAQRLRQVLINLVGNAIKFTEAGEVVLRVQALHVSASQVDLRFAVRDSGIGIAPDKQASIFSGFTQAESSITRRFGGTGLGLAISHRMVSLMGGDLVVDSDVGRGSEFAFTITLQCDPSAEPSGPTPAAGAPTRRALLADDHPAALSAMARSLRGLGWEVHTAESADELLALLAGPAAASTPSSDDPQARPTQAGASWDGVFVDWLMHTLDDDHKRQQVSEFAHAAKIPLVAVITAAGREQLSQGSLQEQSQIDSAVVKPTTASTLIDAWAAAQQADAGHLSAPTPTAPRNQSRLHGLRILVVEDNLNNQQVAQELLEAEGASVHLAGNGEVGVAAVASATPGFDVVLMDLQMPVMDGLSATRQIREQLGIKTLPIIAMTANAMPSDRQACLEAGMNDHVGKPFDLQHLIQTLLQHTGRQLSQATAPAPTLVTVPEEVLQEAAGLGIELGAALRRLGGKPAPYARMLGTFLGEIQLLPTQLAQELADGKRAVVVLRLHTLKGLAATLGDTRLSAVAATAEKAFKAANADASPEAVSPEADQARLAPLTEALANSAAALAQVSERLNALLRAVAPPPPSSPDGGLNQAQWQTRLTELAGLLANSDMRALDVHAELPRPADPLLSASFEALDEAVSALDFARALTHCQALRSSAST